MNRNPDRRWVKITRSEKKQVSRLRRAAEKRELREENVRGAIRATKTWTYA